MIIVEWKTLQVAVAFVLMISFASPSTAKRNDRTTCGDTVERQSAAPQDLEPEPRARDGCETTDPENLPDLNALHPHETSHANRHAKFGSSGSSLGVVISTSHGEDSSPLLIFLHEERKAIRLVMPVPF
jgi:hypothetical protein